MLKDNFYLMEKMMRSEVRHEYEKAISEKDNLIAKFRESFSTYKSELNNEIKEEVAKEIFGLDKKVKQIIDKRGDSAGVLTPTQQQKGGITQQLHQHRGSNKGIGQYGGINEMSATMG